MNKPARTLSIGDVAAHDARRASAALEDHDADGSFRVSDGERYSVVRRDEVAFLRTHRRSALD